MWITDITRKIEGLAAKNKFVYSIASRYYTDVIKSEASLAGITADDHVLCIGGGICPFSAILLHQTTGAKVTVIDNEIHCVSEAQQVVRRLGICGNVNVVHQDGACKHACYKNYTVIHFALQVSPMECVFSQVEACTAPGTKFLIRRPKKHLCGLYSKLSLNSETEVLHKKGRNVGSTLLYVKGA
ncbi:MAG: hypothetical protein FWB74_07100 [Defluviitaleaceae bacterium]|nr:hypothetical protein [Defluviitaleaceae bacterium]